MFTLLKKFHTWLGQYLWSIETLHRTKRHNKINRGK